MKVACSIEEIGAHKWRDFVFDHPNGDFFHSLEYYHSFQLEKTTKSVVIALLSESNEILGLSVFLLRQEKNTLISQFTLRAIAYAPPIIKDNDQFLLGELLNQQHKQLSSKAIYIEYRNVTDEFKGQDQFIKTGFKAVKHLNITINLSVKKNDIYSSMTTTARNKIRKAEKEGVKIKQINPESDAISIEAYRLIRTVYKRISLPFFTYSTFSRATKSLSNSKRLLVFGAYLNDKLISVMLLTLYKQEAYCWYMGTLRNFKKYNATDLLVWETLQYAKSIGIDCFNWGGVGYPNKEYGVRNFKKKFGGTLIQDNRYIKIYQPLIYRMGSWALSILR